MLPLVCHCNHRVCFSEHWCGSGAFKLQGMRIFVSLPGLKGRYKPLLKETSIFRWAACQWNTWLLRQAVSEEPGAAKLYKTNPDNWGSVLWNIFLSFPYMGTPCGLTLLFLLPMLQVINWAVLTTKSQITSCNYSNQIISHCNKEE